MSPSLSSAPPSAVSGSANESDRVGRSGFRLLLLLNDGWSGLMSGGVYGDIGELGPGAASLGLRGGESCGCCDGVCGGDCSAFCCTAVRSRKAAPLVTAARLPRCGLLLLRESGLIERAIEAEVDRRRPLLVRICIVGAGVSVSRGSRRYSLPSTGSA